jgi:hypothetical protein
MRADWRACACPFKIPGSVLQTFSSSGLNLLA